MNNIYNISQELLAIFAEIEENEGELTPELEQALNLTRESLKDKIKSYSNCIKMLEGDISLIKAEKERLSAMQNTKERTINRLKQVMITAIEQFGDDTKSGGKYIDFGTGKVSIRNTEVLEVNDEATNTFMNRYLSGLAWYDMQNQLDRGIVNTESLLNYANNDPDDYNNNLNFSIEDVDKLNADINLQVSIKTLLEDDKGFNLIKSLVQYGNFEVKAKVNKNDIKREIKEECKTPCFVELVNNKTITIK